MRNALCKWAMVWFFCGVTFLIAATLPAASPVIHASSGRQTPVASLTVEDGLEHPHVASQAGSRGPRCAAHHRAGKASASSYRIKASVMGGPPAIIEFTPLSGPVGTSVAIFGAGFDDVEAVRFNGVNAVFTVNSSTQITATVPVGATTGPITVETDDGVTTSAQPFVVLDSTTPGLPLISSFSPPSGPVGTSVTIFGDNFGGTQAVRFNGVNATFTVNSSTQITATVPVGATTGPITVTTPAGTATSQTPFVVTGAPASPPTIASFSPQSGPVGTSVVVLGANFGGTQAVRFNGVNATFTVNSPTQITATVPVGATTGPITVTTPAGTATSQTPFVVTQAPVILSFAPTAGPIGATVTITGANFEGATSVTFNGVNATFTINSSTQITATVPVGATTGLITVITPAGTATSQTPFVVIAPPTITSFAPTTGTVGTTVIIAGTNFEGATSVLFGGVAATFAVNRPTQITATVPIGAVTGPIRVTTPAGTATSSAIFTVTPRVPPQTIGVFRPGQAFLLRQSNTAGPPDIIAPLGQPGDLPVVGDWDGDGLSTVALFRNGQFLIRNENAADAPVTTVAFGQPGDRPIAGDWTGKGFDSIGVFRAGTFLLRNSNTSGSPDIVVNYGLPTDLPLVGDWDGDGQTTIGGFRPANGFFFLRNTNSSGNADLSFFYGLADDFPVAGDWDGDGVTTIGVLRRGTFFLRNTNTAGFADLAVAFGQPDDVPLAGRWKTPPLVPPGDFRTGNSTIVWRNRVTGQNAIWKMDGVNFVESIALPTVEDCWVIGGAADFNGDGNTDLLWRNQDITGFDAVWTFSGTTPTASLPVTPEQTDLNWRISCTGDVDRDGQPDIIRRNTATGAVEIWLMNGRARRSVASVVIPDLALSEQIVGSGDFDRNGLLDLLVHNRAEGKARIVTLLGTTAIGSRPLPALGSDWQLTAVGDYNRDGWPDIVWRNVTTGQNVIWLLRELALVQSVTIPTVSDQRWEIVGPR